MTGASGSGYTGRVVLVTGAAGGIARATANAFAARGASVVGADIDEAGLAELEKDLADFGTPLETVTADVTSAAGAESVVIAARERFGRVDVLANIVGGSRPGKTVVEMDEDDWGAVVSLNLTSAYLMCRFAIPAMVTSGGGAIVNVSSGAGLRGMPRNPAYAAAKAAIVGFTQALAIDHAGEGIRVNCVAPGAVLTPLMRRNRSEEEIAFIARLSLVGRVAAPEEIAAVIAFLASDEASYINGQTVSVDGGMATSL